MCGIIGATNTKEEAVRDALATFAYRGPDARQYYTDESISLGHARLSIIDLDARAHQPFFDEKKEIGIVFNGEIYNYQELRKELEQTAQVRFRTTSDTEVLVEGYRAWGLEGLLPRLRGMFALAFYDLRTHEVLLARDQAGIKPLYYSLERNTLLFSSELKGTVSLMRSAGIPVVLDQDQLALYQVLGYIPSPRTMVKGVVKLERGSWMRYDLRTHTVTQGAWIPKTVPVSTVQEMEEAVRRSVIEHCIADVPVGTFFSGGIDSSLISAILHEAGMDLASYSIHVQGRDADEPYFRSIAKELGLHAHVAEFGLAEFDSLYEDIFSRVDDPIADTSLFPSTYVARLAAADVKVVLSGEGGDELFLGYPRTLVLTSMQHEHKNTSGIFDAAFVHTPSFIGKNKFFITLARSLGYPAAFYLLNTSPGRDLVPRAAWREAQTMLNSGPAPYIDRDWYLENMLLRKTDMATSYASIEGRVPLLGAELWNSAPHFMRQNLNAPGGMKGKTILKNMLAHYISRELIDRPKSGFGLDIGMLFRESKSLSAGLNQALPVLTEIGVVIDPTQESLIKERYPVYGFGLVALHRAIKNLGLV